MPIIKLQIQPGLKSNGTRYQAKNRWIWGTQMRFHEGDLLPIGGWQHLIDNITSLPTNLTGIPRGTLAWQGLTGGAFLAFGTIEKLYAFIEALFDITPVGFIAGSPNSTVTSGGSDYGDDAYNSLLYGVGTASAGDIVDGDVWSLDVFGNFLVGSMFPTDKKLYVWQNLTGTPAAVAPNSPNASRGVLVTPERFLVALGAANNQRRVQWADRETIDVWAPTPTNQAGSFDLEGSGRIMAGRRSRGESLIWTDFDLYAMTFVGGNAVYGFQKRGLECGLISPNAVAATPSGFAWMGERSFFQYDGYARPLLSEVGQLVFDRITKSEKFKVVAVTNREFSEITWYVPTGGSLENNAYVTWNYAENLWMFGALSRTSGFDSQPVTGFPIATDGEETVLGNNLYPVWLMENGTERKDAKGNVVFPPFIESGPFELGDGDKFVHVLQIYPDLEDFNSPPEGPPISQPLDQATVLFKVEDFPQGTERIFGPFSLANPTSVRFNARQVRIRIQQATPDGVPLWRLGDLRLDVRAGGKR